MFLSKELNFNILQKLFITCSNLSSMVRVNQLFVNICFKLFVFVFLTEYIAMISWLDYSPSHSKVMLIGGGIQYPLLLSIRSTNFPRRFIKTLIAITNKRCLWKNKYFNNEAWWIILGFFLSIPSPLLWNYRKTYELEFLEIRVGAFGPCLFS